MIDIPEYKYGRNSLIISACLFLMLYFQENFNRLSIFGIGIFGAVLAVACFSFLATIAYFSYGYRRTHNKVTMRDYKLASYFIPTKERIKWSLKIFFIFTALGMLLRIILSLIIVGNYQVIPATLGSFIRGNLFNLFFMVFFSLVYLLQPFSTKHKKIIISILAIVPIFIFVTPYLGLPI